MVVVCWEGSNCGKACLGLDGENRGKEMACEDMAGELAIGEEVSKVRKKW